MSLSNIFTASLLGFGLVIFSACTKKGELGSANNPVKLYFTPSVDSETITTNSGEFIQFLEKETGLFFETGIPTSYIAVVEAFGSGRADIGVINSFAYLMAHKKYGVEAKLRVMRYGHDYYQGQIVARADQNINSVKDLEGKKFAFTDPASTSGYMFPLKILKDNDVTIGEKVFAGKHDSVITMVYQGQVDAGASYYSAPSETGKIRDARERVKTQFPDVEEKVKIVAITEKIPNDPFVFRKGLDASITEKFIAAVKKFLSTEEGQKTFYKIYSVEGVVSATDADYEPLRKMIDAINIDPASMLK